MSEQSASVHYVGFYMWTLWFQKSSDRDADSAVEIHIEITSNWGHSMRLGLTEIQVFDQNNTLIPISAADVSVYGAEDCKGTIDLLFNGKFKVAFYLFFFFLC